MPSVAASVVSKRSSKSFDASRRPPVAQASMRAASLTSSPRAVTSVRPERDDAADVELGAPVETSANRQVLGG